jgi:hypothetical protein
MHDAEDQVDSSRDPNGQEPAPGEVAGSPAPGDSPAAQDENDNDVVTDDDLPSGG